MHILWEIKIIITKPYKDNVLNNYRYVLDTLFINYIISILASDYKIRDIMSKEKNVFEESDII